MEKQDEIGAGMGTLPLRSFHMTVTHEMCGTGCDVRVNFRNCYLRAVRGGRTVPTLVLFRRLPE